MRRYQTLFLPLLFGLLMSTSYAQTCPKVTYTTQAATLKNLVATVNCLAAAEKAKTARGDFNRTGLQVESFQIVGPQHTRAYKKIVLAILSVPAGNEIHSALVSSESPQAAVNATAGAECKIKLNPDNTVDGLCNETGGTIYVVFQN